MSLLLLAGASFAVFGVVLVLVGATQASLAAALGLDLAETGALAATLLGGLGLGGLGAGPLVDRQGARVGWLLGASLAAAGLACAANAPGLALVFVGLLACGIGCGAVETSLNAAIVRADPERAARRLGLTHAAATAGAVVGAPLLGALSAGSGGYATAYLVLAVGWVLLAALALVVAIEWGGPADASGKRALRLAGAAIAPFAAISFAYVGFETLFTAFAVPWAGARALSPERGVQTISAFYLGLLCSRLGFAALHRAATPAVLGLGGAGAALVLGTGLVLQSVPIEAIAFAAGIGLGPVFPVAIALVAQRFPANVGTATGVVVAAGTAGGWVGPILAGAIGDRLGVDAALWVGVLLGAGVTAAAAGLARARRAVRS